MSGLGQLESLNTSQTRSKHSTYFDPPKNICFKIFIITTVVLGLIAMITSGLAILGYHGVISGLNSIGQLLNIGQVNSYLVLTAGTALFAVAVAAWCCHLRKEKESILQTIETV